MRKFTLLLLLQFILPLCSHFNSDLKAQYQAFISREKTWRVLSCNGPWLNSCSTFTYQFRSDSIIDNIPYEVLYMSTDSIPYNWNFSGLFREDTILQQVFKRFGNEDALLYDFQLQEGDTARVVTGTNPYFPGSQPIWVDSIRTVSFEGQLRKQWYFNTPYYNGQPDSWIEGIGSTNGPFENFILSTMSDYSPMLLCFKENDSLKYIDTNFNSCYIHTLSSQKRNEKPRQTLLFPNPITSNSKLIFPTTELKKIEIFTLVGNPIYQEEIFGEQFQIPELPGIGIFILRIQSSEGNEQIKVVKTN